MQKKPTITIDEEFYEGRHSVIGRGRISQFIEDLARLFVVNHELDDAYRQLAQDKEREAEALEWADAAIGDLVRLGLSRSAGSSEPRLYS